MRLSAHKHEECARINGVCERLLKRLPAATIDLIEGDFPPAGKRHESLREVAFRAAESGLTNHEILLVLSECGERWGKYTSDNLYAKWRALLRILRSVRRQFPNQYPL
jgi:hypothetical protein